MGWPRLGTDLSFTELSKRVEGHPLVHHPLWVRGARDIGGGRGVGLAKPPCTHVVLSHGKPSEASCPFVFQFVTSPQPCSGMCSVSVQPHCLLLRCPDFQPILREEQINRNGTPNSIERWDE